MRHTEEITPVDSEYIALSASMRNEFPKLRVVPKESSLLMRSINFLLRVGTFGKYTGFMHGYTTTIANTIYTPDNWYDLPRTTRCVILRHERVHLRQQKKYGIVLFAFLYLFMFFPVGLAYFRMRFEKEAYEETLKAQFETYGMSALISYTARKRVIDEFVGVGYLWMWPFRESIEHWYDHVVAQYRRR